MLCLDAAGVGAFVGVSARAAPRPFPRAADCTTPRRARFTFVQALARAYSRRPPSPSAASREPAPGIVRAAAQSAESLLRRAGSHVPAATFASTRR